MTPELAKQYVIHRNNNPSETWKESVAIITPHVRADTVRVYVGKYLNGTLSSQRKEGRPKVVEVSSTILDKYDNILYNPTLGYVA